MKTKFNKFLSTLSIAGLLVGSLFNYAYASGALNTLSLVPSTASPATSATHTLHMKPSAGQTTGILSIKLKYCDADGAYGAACSAPSGLALPVSGGVTLTGFGSTVVTSAAGVTNEESIVKTTGTAEVVATDHLIAIAGVTNPAAGTYWVRIQTFSANNYTGLLDEGSVGSATIANVTLSGTQRESLSVTVAGENGQSICDATTQNTTANTATTVNFNDFTGATAINSGQSITVGTNAANGYTASIAANHGLVSGSTYINDAPQIADLSQGTVASTWSAYTGLGICATGTDAKTTMYGTSPYYYHAIANGASSVTKTLSEKAGPASDVKTSINFKVNVDSAMAAGTFTNTVNYTVVPRY